jgi:hypothetical protein
MYVSVEKERGIGCLRFCAGQVGKGSSLVSCKPYLSLANGGFAPFLEHVIL